jgi:hypothetical protein
VRGVAGHVEVDSAGRVSDDARLLQLSESTRYETLTAIIQFHSSSRPRDSTSSTAYVPLQPPFFSTDPNFHTGEGQARG